jgi:hypothetical protein
MISGTQQEIKFRRELGRVWRSSRILHVGSLIESRGISKSSTLIPHIKLGLNTAYEEII